jgi:hypothetical protein
MKPRLLIYILVAAVLTFQALAVRVDCQNVIDEYGTKPSTPERRMANVEFHVALELMKHNYSTPSQKALLVRSLRDPRAVDEDMATVLHSPTPRQKRSFTRSELSTSVNSGRCIEHQSWPIRSCSFSRMTKRDEPMSGGHG